MYRQLPMYQKLGKTAFKKDLTNIKKLTSAIGHPENNFQSIHIAGTNGKGSVSHYIASILQEFGLKVGLYTSPHYKDFRERIKVNGEFIQKRKVVDFIEKITPFLSDIPASFFEMTVAMAFGFWLRRAMDNTDQILWDGLRNLIADFDPAYLSDLKARYATAEVNWDAVPTQITEPIAPPQPNDPVTAPADDEEHDHGCLHDHDPEQADDLSNSTPVRSYYR